MRICVLGTHSFADRGPKIGTQHIAETLERLGHDVTYVTSPASLPTAVLPGQRHRFLAAVRPLRVSERLVQVTPVTLVPQRTVRTAERIGAGGVLAALNRSLGRTRGRVLESAEYDLCICSAAATLALVPRLRARRLAYRLNDLLAGLPGVSRALLRDEGRLLAGRVQAVWPVNEALADYARARTTAPVTVVPNGVDVALFDRAEPDATLAATRERNVVYVGALEYWVDVGLLVETARRLPDRLFHVYGPWAVPVPRELPPNVHVHGPIAHAEIAAKMKACAVGLIPAAPVNRERFVEKPIKYYEYLAAGLGVAATSHAGAGLEPFAACGDTPDALADAIRRAAELAERHAGAIRAEVAARAWEPLVRRMLDAP